MPRIPIQLAATFALVLCMPLFAVADGEKGKASKPKVASGLGDGLGLGFGAQTSGNPWEFSASYEVEEGGARGRVSFHVKLEEGHHIFSTTQPPGGPSATVISLVGQGAKLAGPFTPDTSYEVLLDVLGFEGLRVEQHHDAVVWTAPVLFEPALGETPLALSLKIDGQVCRESCIPIRGEQVKAEFKGFYASAKTAAATGPFREPESPVSWSVSIDKSTVKPGEKLNLVLTATPDAEFHVYKYDPMDPTTDSRTLLSITNKAGLQAGTPVTTSKAIHKDLGGGEEVDFYDGEVTWKIPLTVPEMATDGVYLLKGLIGYQACTDGSCDQPRGASFQVELSVGAKAVLQPANAVLTAIPFNQIADTPNLAKWIDGPKIKLTLSAAEILSKFCLAMLGGLILNFMPCVLPVIGLKILGFVSEAGGDRRKSSMLTLTYAVGIFSLILGLGILSVTVREYTGAAFGWGEQFGAIQFRILITAFMFSLALSFLGVWEIPIPGFAMSKTSTELSNREGFLGAFYKGLITTLLATPCSAPFLGGVFLVALTQPAWVVLLIFAGVGLGMSLPYLAVAAQPSMLSFLPKPGPWMETFKEALAFPMLLSVVFLVSGFLDQDRMAMLSSLMFVWFGCWMIGRVPAWAEANTKLRNWAIATAVAAAGTIGSFYYLQPSQHQLAWQPYDEAKLDALVAEGKTVMIDFTANWCQNCKVNLITAIETKKVKELVETDKIVPMVADFTNYPPALKAKLNELNSLSIPLLAIYSGGDSERPIILRDIITESQLVEALKEAGPSKDMASRPTAAGALSNQHVQ
jgi:suppressor for copper-sensitivity B